MTRQFVNCPATEAHERHMEHLKRLRKTVERQEYIDGVRRAEGKHAAKWLTEDFANWWQQQRPKETAK